MIEAQVLAYQRWAETNRAELQANAEKTRKQYGPSGSEVPR
jgi:hypothetical protein